eukprot:GHVQ01013766.1.p1 GENE.GHVQ01013766.1~~GHVQ01013766.1.p1  ORF type:complete len:703 (-),score=37.11 GHVQ01013766.1:2470-4578(-)
MSREEPLQTKTAAPTALGMKALPVDLEFSGLECGVPNKALSTSEKLWCTQRCRRSSWSVVTNISGSAHPGEVVAIMGPSGCGKTTLLNALSGQSSNLTAGDVKFNGKPRSSLQKGMIGYMLQTDILFCHLTVYETLKFSAMLRLGTTYQERLLRVEQVICQTGLEKCRDTVVGNSMKRGLSGGEAKRLNMAVELLRAPSVLLLDEPTTGLDSCGAASLVNSLSNLAKNSDVTVVTSLHQPSHLLLKMLDRIILMTAGTIIYQGETCNLMPYFKAIGYCCPSDDGIVEFIADLSNDTNKIPHLMETYWKNIRRSSQGRFYMYLDGYPEAPLAVPNPATSADGLVEDSIQSCEITPTSPRWDINAYSNCNMARPADQETVECQLSDGLRDVTINPDSFCNEKDPTAALKRQPELSTCHTNATIAVTMAPDMTTDSPPGGLTAGVKSKSCGAMRVQNTLMLMLKCGTSRAPEKASCMENLPSYWVQVFWLFIRCFEQIRGGIMSWIGISQQLSLALICGAVFFQVFTNDTEDSIMSFVGFGAIVPITWSLYAYHSVTPRCYEDFVVYARERVSNTYSISAYFIASGLSNFIALIILPSAFLCIVFPMAGLPGGFERFLIIWGFMLLALAGAVSMAEMLAALIPSIHQNSTAFFIYISASVLLSKLLVLARSGQVALELLLHVDRWTFFYATYTAPGNSVGPMDST